MKTDRTMTREELEKQVSAILRTYFGLPYKTVASEIASLIEQNKPKPIEDRSDQIKINDGMAEEILSTKKGIKEEGILTYIAYHEAIEAMEQYRTEGLREELIKFMESLSIDKYQDNPDIDIIDEYLKQKGLPL